jgi:serine/threonine protein kinase
LEEVDCLREIQALKRVNPHPNLIQLEDVLLFVVRFYFRSLWRFLLWCCDANSKLFTRFKNKKKLMVHVFSFLDYRIVSDPGTGTLYLAFELMDCNLYDLISKKTTLITESKVKLWFFQVCKGLEYLHGKNIFHRDIKPGMLC